MHAVRIYGVGAVESTAVARSASQSLTLMHIIFCIHTWYSTEIGYEAVC
jgi:hypothetical protein